MGDVKVELSNGSGELHGALFKNAATDEAINNFADQARQESKEQNRARKAKEYVDEHNEKAKQEYAAQSSGYLADIAGNITAFAARAYKQEIDLEADIKGILDIASSAVMGVGSAVLSLTGPIGKFAKFSSTAFKSIGDADKDAKKREKRNAQGIFATIKRHSDALNKFGELAKNFFEGGLQELLRYRETFQEISAAGAGFGGDLLEIKGASAQMRMTIQEFSNVVRDESKQLAGIGATTTDSVKQLALFTDTFNDNMEDTVMNLMNMGYTTQEINEALRKQMTTNRRMDFEDAAVREREQKAAADLAYELDTISRLTGIQRAELQKEIDERRRKAEVEATIMQLDMDGSRGVGNAFREAAAQVSQFGPGAVQALQEIFTQGVAHTPEAQATLTAMGSAGDELTNLALRIRQGGDQTDLGMEFVGAMMDRMNQSDFLSQVKLGPLGVEVGQAAGEFITSGGKAIYDALYKQGDELKNLPFAERYKKAVEAVEEARKKELEDRDTNGKKLNNALNVMEKNTRDIGVAMAEQVALNINQFKLFGEGIELATDGIKAVYDHIEGMIAPDEQLFTGEVTERRRRAAELERLQAEADAEAERLRDLKNAAKKYEEAGSIFNKESFGVELGNMLPEPEPVEVTVKSEMMDEFAKEYPKLYALLEKVQIGNIKLLDTFENFHTRFQSFLDQMQEKIGKLKDAIIESMKTAGRLIGLALQGDFETLVTDIGSIADNVQETTDSYLDKAKGFFSNLIGSDEEEPLPPVEVEVQVEAPPPPKIAPETILGYQNIGSQMQAQQVKQEAARAAREEIEKSQAERQSDIDFLNTTTNEDVVSQLKKNDERIQELIEVSKYSAGQHMEQTNLQRQSVNTRSTIGSFA